LKYLLDTHALLWIVSGDSRLSKKARSVYLDEANAIFASMATIWELAVKISLKKMEITGGLSDFVTEHVHGNSMELLPIQLAHCCQLQTLAFHHRDPFDRMIIAQAIVERLTIISADKEFDPYPIKRIW
jgi:PIN domain nuclease of toxin-antitoxin system